MGETKSIPINKIIIAEDNPRQTFDEPSLIRLGESIKSHGLIQPIVVRPKEGYYELVVGERRLRAVELMGLKEIDARIEEIDDATLMELRLIENTHREDLTNAEKGDAVLTLWERYPNKYPTIKSIAEAIDISYVTIQHWIAKSEKLSPKVNESISRGILTERAAQLLLKYDHETQEKLANAIIKYDIRGGREGAERRFIQLYDENPDADLRELAEKAKGIETVRVPLEELSREARKEVEEILEEKEKEAKERRKKGREKARRVSRGKRRRKAKPKPEEKILEKAEEITEKLAELEPEEREKIAETIERRLDALAKSVDKETLEWIEKWKSDITPKIKKETPERLAMKLEEILHGIWIQIWVEYPQSVKEVARKQMARSFSMERLERLQKTINITVNELDDFNGIVGSELFTRRHKVR